MGMILNGVYTSGKADIQKLAPKRSSTWKQHDHNRQRKDYASEITQPFNRDGTPNEAFIENFPEEAVDYGFIKSEAELVGLPAEEAIGREGATIVAADVEKIVAELPEEHWDD